MHLACQSLLNGECDMALAGASGIDIPQEHGHFYQEGMIFSPDGHCRPYDAQAEGIVSGNGVGVVLLKRLEDALRDRDDIHAVILGTAINNDGNSKVAYSAPSLEGQSEVIAEALGVSRQAVSKWESGASDPSTANLIAIAKLYGVSAEEILRKVRKEE